MTTPSGLGVECSEYHTETLLVTSRKYRSKGCYSTQALPLPATVTAAATKGRRVALSVCAARERQRLVRRRVCQPHLQAQRSTATCAHGWRQKPGECPRAFMRARSAVAADVEMKLEPTKC